MDGKGAESRISQVSDVSPISGYDPANVVGISRVAVGPNHFVFCRIIQKSVAGWLPPGTIASPAASMPVDLKAKVTADMISNSLLMRSYLNLT